MLVELASLMDANLLASAVSHALGLRLGGDEISFEAVARAIGKKQAILILDNCEHLIGAAATFADTIVRMCPAASILATSREALRIEGEYVYSVPPLEVPPQDCDKTDRAEEYGAVQLFLTRTRAGQCRIATEKSQLGKVAEVCRSLDGIPLAIEFAAARAATLGLDALAARLGDRFKLLTSGHRTALARHQTLRATLDWSYDFLTRQERRLLQRLAIFAAGFTLDAAIYVMSDTDLDDAEIIEQLSNLVAKSLVMVDGSTRWRLLETIRAYALEKAAGSGEAELGAKYHAKYFQQAFSSPKSDLHSSPGALEVDADVKELDNVRVALDWSFSVGGDEWIGIRLTAGYAPILLRLALMTECRDRATRALSSLRAMSRRDERLEMELRIALGTTLVFTMGSVEAASRRECCRGRW
ncbi:ATP-binding protein [Bradyrhizobium sp. 1(2017)]|uniref:ATP-binding protein n=1 Tax=Bradyrhizobium sp. 1(2017) TaxID=1404888 RepID=UPI001FEDE237|nr:hypothetical protein [Bradyrhizobium sp. 1(2017)]